MGVSGEQQVVCWVEPRGVGRAAIGDEAGIRVGRGIMEGPGRSLNSAAGSRKPVPQGWSSASGSGSGAKWREEAGTPLGRPWLAAGD